MNGAKPLPPREEGGPESLGLVPGRKHLVLEHDLQAARHGEAPAIVPEGLHPIVERAIPGTTRDRCSARTAR